MPKILMSIFVDPATDAKLQLIKEHSKVGKSAMIREAIEQWIERRERLGKRTTVKPFMEKRGPKLGVERSPEPPEFPES